MYGNDWEYAGTRLHETVVRWGDKPIYVEAVGAAGAISRLLGSDKMELIPLDDLNLKPVSLGYINYHRVASYVVRVPKRRDWRQGMRHGNIRSISGLPAQEIPLDKMVDTISGKYPSYRFCLEGVNRNYQSLAWHRHWAVVKPIRPGNLTICYKGEAVGSVIEGQPMLDEKHQYLKEYLKECS